MACGAIDLGTQKRLGYGPTSSHQTGRTGGTLHWHIGGSLLDADQVARSGYSRPWSVGPVSTQAEFRLASRTRTAGAFHSAKSPKVAPGKEIRMINY